MKKRDAIPGKYVFIKKSSPVYDPLNRALLIKDIVKTNRGSSAIFKGKEESIDISQLTDVPCSMMECGRCKYHNRKRK